MKPFVTFLGGCAHGFRCEDPETAQWVAFQFPMPPPPTSRASHHALAQKIERDIYDRHMIITDGERICVYVLAGMRLLDGLHRAFKDCHTHHSLK